MIRQLFLVSFYIFWASSWLLFPIHSALAKPANDNTLVVPSPQHEPEAPNGDLVDHQQIGLDSTFIKEKTPAEPVYHLEPRPSATFALSRGYETSEKDHTGWVGLHVAPWMFPTTRTQIGLDLHNRFGWLQFAVHSLPTRNLYRLYWGGGASIVVDSEKELRSFLKIDSYHVFIAGGWELQLLDRQNIRFEMNYHQGLDTSYVKALIGYTLQF